MSLRHRILTLAAAGALVFGAFGDAMAKPGGGGSFGSRGSKTYSAPPSTTTAPSTAAPIQRSQTPQATPSAGVNRPQAAQPAGGMFGKGMLGGLAAGLLGAGLIGMLMGNGFAGGLGSIMSFLGLLLQVGLIFFVVKFAIGFFRNRSNPAPAGAAAYGAPQPAPGPTPPSGGPLGGMGGLGAGGLAGGLGGMMGGAPAAPATRKLALTPEDFGAFEKRLQDVQMAFGREDRAALMTLMTPEMTGYLVEELENNARDGVVNKISDPRLLQGDLSEAWAEPDAEYATVAMRFSLIDVVVDRATGRTVSGSLTTPAEAVELWTFRRRPAGAPGDWMLSAIQQVS